MLESLLQVSSLQFYLKRGSSTRFSTVNFGKFSFASIFRSAYSQVFCQIVVLKNFYNIHKKTPLMVPPFGKITGLQLATPFEKRL